MIDAQTAMLEFFLFDQTIKSHVFVLVAHKRGISFMASNFSLQKEKNIYFFVSIFTNTDYRTIRLALILYRVVYCIVHTEYNSF
jgi:hypothetical protein